MSLPVGQWSQRENVKATPIVFIPRRDHCQARLLRDSRPSNSTSSSTASDSGWTGIADGGRPRELTLRQAVKAVVTYFRTNVTQEVIAELLFVDQSTISRAISDLEEIIAEALDEFVPELPEEIQGRVAVVDGALCPCWSWTDAPEQYSGKHKTTGHTHQFVCDLSGNTHDAPPRAG